MDNKKKSILKSHEPRKSGTTTTTTTTKTTATSSSSTTLPPSSSHHNKSNILGSHFPTFRVDLKYRNNLPQIPFDPKFLEIPFPSDFLWGYRQSTLEHTYKYKIHMNPPQLSDDMIDPLGTEEWTKSMEYDEKDKALQRKEGIDAKATRKLGTNREGKTWMLKTSYTRQNHHRQFLDENPQYSEQQLQDELENDSEENRKLAIEQQFEFANHEDYDSRLNIPTGKQIKRSLPLIPARKLRGLDLHLIRFKLGEKIMKDSKEPDDPIITSKAFLIHRNGGREQEDGKRPNPFHPLSLFLPRKIARMDKKKKKDKKSDDDDDDEEEEENGKGEKEEDNEEDLFADEDEDNNEASKKKKKEEEEDEEENGTQTFKDSKGEAYDSEHVEYIREFMVQVNRDDRKNDRIALYFEKDAVRYVELEPDTLRLFRTKFGGDSERFNLESNVVLNIRTSLSKDERDDQERRRRDIEGGVLSIDN